MRVDGSLQARVSLAELLRKRPVDRDVAAQGLRAAPARARTCAAAYSCRQTCVTVTRIAKVFFRSSISTQMAEVSPEIRQALLDVFSVLDRNGSMQIDQKEIGFLMNKMLHFN